LMLQSLHVQPSIQRADDYRSTTTARPQHQLAGRLQPRLEARGGVGRCAGETLDGPLYCHSSPPIIDECRDIGIAPISRRSVDARYELRTASQWAL
jgi:hypothetical protein